MGELSIFRHSGGSRNPGKLWTPAFAGVTNARLRISLQNLVPRFSCSVVSKRSWWFIGMRLVISLDKEWWGRRDDHPQPTGRMHVPPGTERHSVESEVRRELLGEPDFMETKTEKWALTPLPCFLKSFGGRDGKARTSDILDNGPNNFEDILQGISYCFLPEILRCQGR